MFIQYYSASSDVYISLLVIDVIISIIMVAWVYNDAQRRNMDACAWACVTCFCGCIGLIAYLITRTNYPVQTGPQAAYPGTMGSPISASGQVYQGDGLGPTPTTMPTTPPGMPPSGAYDENSTYMYPSGETARPGPVPDTYSETPTMIRPGDTQTIRPDPMLGSGPNVKRCKFCGLEVPAEVRYCPQCGGDQFVPL